MDFYERLEIGRDATPEQIKKAYRKLARKWHPDMNPNDPNATKIFKEVQRAYETLENAHKKFVYDQRNPPKPKKEKKKEKKKEIDLVEDPNLGNYRTPTAPLFDIWGNRLTPAQRKAWVEEAKNEAPIPKKKGPPEWTGKPSSKLMYEDDYESGSQPYIR